MIVDEPLHAAFKTWELIDGFGFQGFHTKQRNEAHHGADLQEMVFAVGEMQNVVVKTVFFVPQGFAARSKIVYGMGDVDGMLTKYAGDIFVSAIFFGKFERDSEHVEAIHAHPTGAIGLLEMAAGGKRRGAIENADIVQAQKTALKNIGAVGIFSIDPPGEIQ